MAQTAAEAELYKIRFENLQRVTHKITSSLDIGEILEKIRDEAKRIIPQAKEACLLMYDTDAKNYMRPLHCAVYKRRINCQLCKRGRRVIQEAVQKAGCSECVSAYLKSPDSDPEDPPVSELAFPIYEGGRLLAVLDVLAEKGTRFSDTDMVLLQDLVDLAKNAIINAKKHWAVSQQKLTADKILGHLKPFVPQTVRKIIEKNPDSPGFEKRARDVSVLFLDLAEYTSISEFMSQQKVNFIIERYFSEYLDTIYNHNGDINETAGDGLMIIFQQRGKKNNAIQAVRAAMEIRDKTARINEELKEMFNPVTINIGINSGRAWLGMTRLKGKAGTRMTFTASGPVTNLAARLASSAENGEILLGPKTAERVKGMIKVKRKKECVFKNIKEPVVVFSIEDGKPQAPSISKRVDSLPEDKSSRLLEARGGS